MFNLPYIAYGVFALVTIAGIFLGVKKGFRYSLYFFVLLLISIGIAAGISSGVYPVVKKPIAHMLQKYFNGASGYGYEYLVEATKPQAYALLISLFTIAVFPFAFLATWFLRNLAERFDAPRIVHRISANSKQVIFKNPIINKSLSISVTTLTSLGSASVVAAALAPIVTKPKDTNFFYQAVGKISQAMTFGQGYSSDRMQDLYSIIPLTQDASLMKGFDFFFAPGGTMSSTDVTTFNASKNKSTLISLLETNDIGAIGNFITSAGSVQKLLPIGSDATMKDELDAPAIAKIKDILKQYDLSLSSSAIDQTFEFIKAKAVQQFEDTWAARQVKDAQATLDNLKNVILKMKRDELNQLINLENQKIAEFSSLKNQRPGIIANIKQTIDENNKLVAQIKAQAPITESAEQQRDSTLQTKNAEQATLEQLTTTQNNAQADLNSAKSQAAAALSQLQESQTADKSISALTIAQQIAANDEAKALTALNTATSKNTSAQTAYSAAQNVWRQATTDKQNAEVAHTANSNATTQATLNAAIKAESDAAASAGAASRAANIAENEMISAQNAHSDAHQKAQDASAKLQAAQNLANQLVARQTANDNAKANQTTKQSTWEAAAKAVNIQRGISDKANAAYASAESNYGVQKAALDNLTSAQQSAFEKVNTTNGTLKISLDQNKSEAQAALDKICEIQYHKQDTQIFADITYSQSASDNSNHDVTFTAPNDTLLKLDSDITSNTDYKKSRWYLSSETRDEHYPNGAPLEVPLPTKNEDVSNNGNAAHQQAKPFLSKDINGIGPGTEGYIEVLNFNIDQMQDHINDLGAIKTTMKGVYDSNLDALKTAYEDTV